MHNDRRKQDKDIAEKKYQDYLEGASIDLEEYDWQYGYLEGKRLRISTVEWQKFIHPKGNVIDLEEKSKELYALHEHGTEEQIKAYFNRERRLSLTDDVDEPEEVLEIVTPQTELQGHTSVFNQDGDIYVERYKLDLFEHLKNKYEERESPKVLLTELENLEKELGKETCDKVKHEMKETLQEDPFIHPSQKKFVAAHLFDDSCSLNTRSDR